MAPLTDLAILNGATSSLINRDHNKTVVGVIFFVEIVLLYDLPRCLLIAAKGNFGVKKSQGSKTLKKKPIVCFASILKINSQTMKSSSTLVSFENYNEENAPRISTKYA